MPLPIPILAAGIGAAGQIGNSILQGIQNQKTQRWDEKMLNWQHDIALTDWGLQNQYNSPVEQMKRLKEAGLNPNLVYGNGATAMSGGTIKASSAPDWNPRPIQFDTGAVFGQYMQTKIQEQQIDNMEAQRRLIEQQNINVAADTGQKLANTESLQAGTKLKNIDIDFAPKLKEMSLNALAANVENVKAHTTFTLDENERKQAMLAPNLRIAAEQILNMRMMRAKDRATIDEIKQRINNLQQEYRLKSFDEKSQENGIPRNSPAWWRALQNLVGQIGIDKFTPEELDVIRKKGFNIDVGQ